ncbi:MAG: fatty acid--CoA ligase family protein [Bacillaceae bacterium]
MNLLQSLQVTSQSHQDKIAYVFQDKPTTYGELGTYVSMFAGGLANLGVKKGDHIALILGNSPHFIIGLYGAWRLGATVIPINPLYTPEEIAYILNNGDVNTIVTFDVLVPLVQKMAASIPNVKNIIACETSTDSHQELPQIPNIKMKTFTELIKLGTTVPPVYEAEPDDVAVILYTSGTTGKPKGAMLTHKNLYSNASDVAEYLQFTNEDRVIAALPMFHVFCLTVVVNASIVNGATMLIMPKFSPQELFRLANTYEASIFAGVPTMYNFALQVGKQAGLTLSTLRLCISGGASLPVALLKAFEEQFGVAVSEGYGLSEASPVTCFNPLDRPRKPGSIGPSIINVENKVVNELGEEVPVGEVGELIVRGPNVMKGYYKMPEDTMSAIKDDWLYTGDLARMDEDGYFYIVDRKKDMIIVGGYNVYPREVEEALYHHPDVLETIVLGVPDENFGEAVVAFVVPKTDTLTEAELIAYCKEHLAKYKIPAKFVFIEELPKNTTGKILRRALRDQMQEEVEL